MGHHIGTKALVHQLWGIENTCSVELFSALVLLKLSDKLSLLTELADVVAVDVEVVAVRPASKTATVRD